jgi:HD superfamily phosphohydrolase
MNRKRKVFQDTVHGNIYVPEEYCDNFIDTIHFQRLRRIEQTSMRSLFPSARHDRFIHSLGTFHLGCKIFQAIKHNSLSDLSDVTIEFWDKIQKTFEIACLLHDCGHSPFSHTFEKYFDKPECLLEKLVSEVSDVRFVEDINAQADAAPHEKVSAYLVLKIYKDKIIKVGADPILVARMIIGCLYTEENTLDDKIGNCFIALLKGKIIDVDRLDYVTRDKWASGFSASNVNIERLLAAACIKKDGDKLVNCFYKNALSEIQSVIDVKNFQHLWIFSHHKVQYDQYILEKAIEKLATLLTCDTDKEKSLHYLFNVDSFFSHTNIGNHKIYLPSDDDLVHFLKNFINENDYAKEWLSRDHKYKPIWKTFAEYNTIFRNLSSELLEESGNLNKQSDNIIKKFLKNNNTDETNYLKLVIRPKIKSIGPNEVSIAINDTIMDYDIFKLPKKIDNLPRFFFYIFIPEHLLAKSDNLIDKLQKIK